MTKQQQQKIEALKAALEPRRDKPSEGGGSFAFPSEHRELLPVVDEPGRYDWCSVAYRGMELRAYIATHAMQAMLQLYPNDACSQRLAQLACAHADALIQELEK